MDHPDYYLEVAMARYVDLIRELEVYRRSKRPPRAQHSPVLRRARLAAASFLRRLADLVQTEPDRLEPVRSR